MRFGIVVFPGSNCDHDCEHALGAVLGEETVMIFHKETRLPPIDALILPGGFSYGDYLRTGAIARFSPVMPAVMHHIERGGIVLGICNGFQVLLESGVLPGAMRRNRGLRFLCRDVHVRCENRSTPFTCAIPEGRTLRMPIAHHDGNYYVDKRGVAELLTTRRAVFRYATPEGEVADCANPNGSVEGIAGVLGPEGNVLGMMPHPERASEALLGCEDGKLIFESMVAWVKENGPVGRARRRGG